MTNEFNLSDRRKECKDWAIKHFDIPEGAIEFIFDEIEKDDTDFIKRLKEHDDGGFINIRWVDELAGEKLI